MKQWRNLAFCMSAMPNCNDKCCKKLMENFKCYMESLQDEEVFNSFQQIIAKVHPPFASWGCAWGGEHVYSSPILTLWFSDRRGVGWMLLLLQARKVAKTDGKTLVNDLEARINSRGEREDSGEVDESSTFVCLWSVRFSFPSSASSSVRGVSTIAGALKPHNADTTATAETAPAKKAPARATRGAAGRKKAAPKSKVCLFVACFVCCSDGGNDSHRSGM